MTMIIRYRSNKSVNEDRRSEIIKKYIKANSPYFPKELEMKVSELPDVTLVNFEKDKDLLDNCIKNGQNLLAMLRLKFLNTFDINHKNGPYEYIPGLARIAIDELKMFFNEGGSDMKTFKKYVDKMMRNENTRKKFDENLNGLHYEEFVNEVSNFAGDSKIDNSDVKTSSGYKIVPIMSYDDAHVYHDMVDWCVTNSPEQYKKYCEGGRRFYFCLKDEFEKVKRVETEKTPLDEYGLSMISVLVDCDGNPNYITTRWNHYRDGENNPNLMNAEQLQKITGMNFENNFKPYSDEELAKMKILSFSKAKELLEKGVEPSSIFIVGKPVDGISAVVLNDKTNYLKDGKLMFDEWLNYGYPFSDKGKAVVITKEGANIINRDGKMLIRKGVFDDMGDFHNGVAWVEMGGTYSFVTEEGNFLTKEWMTTMTPVSADAFKIGRDKKYNIFTYNDGVISRTWFDDIGDFDADATRVEKKGKYNFIRSNGDFISDTWYDDAADFVNDVAAVMTDERVDFIDKNGNYVTDMGFDRIGLGDDGNVLGYIGNDKYKITTKGAAKL